MSRNRLPTALLALFGFALALRLSFALPVLFTEKPGYNEDYDATFYRQMALNLTEGHGYSVYPGPPYRQSAFRTPGYPLFLLPFYAGPLDERGVILFQVWLSALTAVALFGAGALLRSARVGLLAGLVYSVSPLSSRYGAMLMSETLFTFGLVTLFLLFILYRRRGWTPLVLLGLGAGALALIRPLALFLPLLLVWWCYGGRANRAALFLAASFLLPGIWTARNQVTYGRLFYATVAEVNLLYYNGVPVYADREEISYKEAGHHFLRQINDSFSLGLTEEELGLTLRVIETPEITRWMADRGSELVLSDPLRYAKLHALGVVRLLFEVEQDRLPLLYGLAPERQETLSGDSGIRGWLERKTGYLPPFYRYYWLASVALLVLVLLPVPPALLRGRRPALLGLLLCTLVYLTCLTNPRAYPRFRVPAEPFIALLAACGLMRRRNAERD